LDKRCHDNVFINGGMTILAQSSPRKPIFWGYVMPSDNF